MDVVSVTYRLICLAHDTMLCVPGRFSGPLNHIKRDEFTSLNFICRNGSTSALPHVAKPTFSKYVVMEYKPFSFLGQAGLYPGQVADSMMDAMVEMVELNPQSTLKLIRIVIFQAPMLNDFYKSMQNREYTIIQQKDNTIYSKLKSMNLTHNKQITHNILS